MGISRSSFYSFRSSFTYRQEKDAEALNLISQYFYKSKEKAGIDSLDMMLRRDGYVINHKKIARIKKEYGLVTKIRKKNPYKHIPLKSGEHIAVPNLLNRDFYPLFPDNVYSTDMTYLYYGKCEKVYLSATKDLATNEIVSYKIMTTPTVATFVNEFKELIHKLPPKKRHGLIVHSDQGFQYTSPAFRETLAIAGVTQSMSRKGNCLDNAPIESFFGHLKDLLDLKQCKSSKDVELEVDKIIKYYNEERPQKALNKKPPVEYRGLFDCFF